MLIDENKILKDENTELAEKNTKSDKKIKEFKHKINNIQKVSPTKKLKSLDKPASFIRKI